MLEVIDIYNDMLGEGAAPSHVLRLVKDHRDLLQKRQQFSEPLAHQEAIVELDSFSESLYKLIDREEIACL